MKFLFAELMLREQEAMQMGRNIYSRQGNYSGMVEYRYFFPFLFSQLSLQPKQVSAWSK